VQPRARHPELTIRILLVDDERVVREVLALLLISLGHTVVAVASGAEALARLEAAEPYDLVLTDLVMPGLGGWELVRRIRERWPTLPVGVMSGNHDSLAERRVPVDVTLTKPVFVDTLRAELARLAARGA